MLIIGLDQDKGRGVTVTATVIDAHVHLWDLDRRPQPWIDPATMGVIHRDFGLTDFHAAQADAGVQRGILVQVLNDPAETDDYFWLARDPALLGVVAWVDLLDPHVDVSLDALAAHPSGTRLLGVRHQALAERDPAGWLTAAGEGPGLSALAQRRLPLDLILRPEHLVVAREVSGRHTDLVMVLNHAGKAPVASGWDSPEARHWATRVADLARLPKVACKLSGMTTMADLVTWSVADLRPFVDHLLECFGPDRLLFGSDWPVSLRAGAYAATVTAARTLVAELSESEQRAVLSGTAEQIYHSHPMPSWSASSR